MNTLPNDIARCNGDWHEDGADSGWREGCETCLRRTAPRPEYVWMITPPPIIAFECEYLIEPNVKVHTPLPASASDETEVKP
jgi:hypothetical protein